MAYNINLFMNLQPPLICPTANAEVNQDNTEECNDEIHENAFTLYEENLKYVQKLSFTKSGNRFSLFFFF